LAQGEAWCSSVRVGVFEVKMIRPTMLFILLTVCDAYKMQVNVSPVQKVIQLMNEMASKGRQEKQDEEVAFAAYKQFCTGTSTEKASNIEDADAQIEELQASIQKAESDAANLADGIAKLDQDIAGWANDIKEATAVREKDNADFQETHRDYSESLDALDRAISTLKKQDYDREQAAALLQAVSFNARVPASAKRDIATFIQAPAGQANAYEFQSGGIVEMLEDLKEKFDEERSTLEKEEMNGKHAFDMMMLELKDSTDSANNERATKAKTKAQREEDAAGSKGELADTTSSRDEDQKYLDELNAQCSQKSSDYENRQALRTEELEAIQKAIEIIGSGAVSGASEKHSRLIQQSFAFMSSKTKVPENQRQVAEFLQRQSERLNSRQLSMLATQIAADPFGKVRNMIDKMITKLLEEANEEATQKGWCDTEMSTNKQTRDDKTEQVNSLQAGCDKLSADISTLGQQIADLSEAIAEVDRTVVEATEIRNKDNAKNKETIDDAEQAQTAVGQALQVLKDFYEKAAAGAENLKMGYDGKTRAALIQGPADDAPESFDSEFKGNQDQAGGVVGMLEVIQSDFSRLEAETTAAESEAANEFDRFMAESKKDKAVKTADLDHKKRSKTSKESDLNDTTNDLKGTEKELQSAQFYFEKLEPKCVDAGVSHEERVAAREKEIESLKQALEILSS